MRKGMMAGLGLAMIGLGVATPAAAEDWRACVVGACLKGVCGPNDASVVVSMAMDIEDPAINSETQAKIGLLEVLNRRNQPMSQPMMNCTPTQPSAEAAKQLSQNIYAQMKTSFSDTTLVSPNDVFPGYDSVPGSEDPRYNGGASAGESGNASDSGNGSDAARAEALAAAQAQAAKEEREHQAAVAKAEQERRQQEATHAAEAQKQRERVAAEQQAAKKREEAANSLTDAKSCVTQPVLQSNATFQGNTGASVVNGCGRPVDVRICLMTEKGWNCGMTNGLQPQASWSWSSFHATGQVFYDARINGSGRQLTSP